MMPHELHCVVSTALSMAFIFFGHNRTFDPTLPYISPDTMKIVFIYLFLNSISLLMKA